MPPRTSSTAGQNLLHAKLVRVRAALNGEIRKGEKRVDGKYTFVEAKTVGRQFVTALGDEGLTMLPVEIEEGTESETVSGKQFVRTVKVTWQITDSESGESINVVSMGQGADSGDKAIPKALTNAMKYAILLVLQAAGDDPEADQTTEAEATSSSRPRRERSTPAPAPTAAAEDPEGAAVREALASNRFKSMLRAKAHEVGLTDEQFKALAVDTSKKESSKDWTGGDAQLVLNALEQPMAVAAYKEIGRAHV